MVTSGFILGIMTRHAVNRVGTCDLFVCRNRFSNQVILIKYLIANMAGFLLWLSITNIMTEVFKVALAQSRLILSTDMIYYTMEGIVPSRCRLTTWHLGATLFKLSLHQIHKSHVAASMHHDTWGLMQSHFLLTFLKTRLITW